jgi:tRNA-specific 2-thiouridylase
MTKVVVALSGGVDSSVSAALLVEQGYEVVGATMRLWSAPGCEEENRCCTPQTRELAAQLAEQLGIPFHILDAQQAFRQAVVQRFLDGYSRGDTPNPCVYCNRYLKWDYLWQFAQSIGAEAIATGHYARLRRGTDGTYELWKGVDATKDQTYFLSLLTQQHLAHTLFPLGEYTKVEVRQIAHARQLPAADQPESQDLCFLGKRDYRDFLRENAPQAVQPGEIVDQQGKVLGKHNGLAFYTIGQRKGMPASAHALYVYQKDLEHNRLVVGTEAELGADRMQVREINWIAGNPPADYFEAEVKIRFKAVPALAQIEVQPEGSAMVHFAKPLRDITPGQLAVFYQGEKVLGGGWINASE